MGTDTFLIRSGMKMGTDTISMRLQVGTDLMPTDAGTAPVPSTV